VGEGGGGEPVPGVGSHAGDSRRVLRVQRRPRRQTPARHVNTPEPPPPSSPARRLVWPLFVGVLVCGAVFGGWYLFTQIRGDREDQIRRQDRDDPSLDFDEPWPTQGYIIENGRAYDQATIVLPPGTEVILPEDREGTSFIVQTNG